MRDSVCDCVRVYVFDYYCLLLIDNHLQVIVVAMRVISDAELETIDSNIVVVNGVVFKARCHTYLHTYIYIESYTHTHTFTQKKSQKHNHTQHIHNS